MHFGYVEADGITEAIRVAVDPVTDDPKNTGGALTFNRRDRPVIVFPRLGQLCWTDSNPVGPAAQHRVFGTTQGSRPAIIAGRRVFTVWQDGGQIAVGNPSAVFKLGPGAFPDVGATRDEFHVVAERVEDGRKRIVHWQP